MIKEYGIKDWNSFIQTINGLTWSLARELGPSNIRVNAVAPGITKTDMVAALPEQVIAPLIKMIPLKLFQPLGQSWRLILFNKNENIVH